MTMTDVAAELAELLDRYWSWRVEYQDHPPAWVATRRPSPAQVHVLAAYDLGSLRDKLASAETLSTALADLRHEFAGSGVTFGTVWASAAGPGARRLYASRAGVLITSWTAAELRSRLREELAGEQAAPGGRLALTPEVLADGLCPGRPGCGDTGHDDGHQL